MALMERFNRTIYVLCAGICLFCIGVITISLSAQILSRYVFNIPLQYTDDMAEISLVWLTFLGAAVLYREGGHIAITALPDLLPPRWRAVLRIAISVMTAAALILVITQVQKVAPTMSRVTYGSLPTIPFYSKYAALFVPLGIGCAVTILFAATDIAGDLRRLFGSLPAKDDVPPGGDPGA